jgi:CRP-like cAMP-binding protein
MSLLTGAPRSATVRAVTEVGAVSVGKAAFAELMNADPRIAEAMADVLYEREADTARAIEEHSSSRTPPARADLLKRIRSFFGVPDPAG